MMSLRSSSKSSKKETSIWSSRNHWDLRTELPLIKGSSIAATWYNILDLAIRREKGADENGRLKKNRHRTERVF
jgi:hypothetical protein